MSEVDKDLNKTNSMPQMEQIPDSAYDAEASSIPEESLDAPEGITEPSSGLSPDIEELMQLQAESDNYNHLELPLETKVDYVERIEGVISGAKKDDVSLQYLYTTLVGGNIHLNHPVMKWIEEFRDKENKPISEMLQVAHESGLPVLKSKVVRDSGYLPENLAAEIEANPQFYLSEEELGELNLAEDRKLKTERLNEQYKDRPGEPLVGAHTSLSSEATEDAEQSPSSPQQEQAPQNQGQPAIIKDSLGLATLINTFKPKMKQSRMITRSNIMDNQTSTINNATKQLTSVADEIADLQSKGPLLRSERNEYKGKVDRASSLIQTIQQAAESGEKQLAKGVTQDSSNEFLKSLSESKAKTNELADGLLGDDPETKNLQKLIKDATDKIMEVINKLAQKFGMAKENPAPTPAPAP